MPTTHPGQEACRHMGHAYATVAVMRCPHLESYTASVSVFCDHLDGETRNYLAEELEFGPFDSHQDIANAVSDLTFLMIRRLRDIPVTE